MVARSLRLGLLIFCAFATLEAQDGPAKTSAEVIVRGSTRLDLALSRAVGGALVNPRAARSVTLVTDVTPYVRDNEADLVAALTALQQEFGSVGAWRLARLGDAPGPRRSGPKDLIPDLRSAFRGDDLQNVDTLRGLRWAIRGVDGPGVVVYLADWNAEDDHDVEETLRELQRKRLQLHVIGAEGCFGRPWMDGFFPPDRGQRDGLGGPKLYETGVGRSPLGPDDPPDLPRHGDTAFPALPFHWHGAFWVTAFPVQLKPLPARRSGEYAGKERRAGRSGTAEDLRERRNAVHEESEQTYSFPLPSSFGPYALSRLVAETGGRYVLWSWNRTGRSQLVYDDTRCDRFAPDLRAREAIRLDAVGRPLVRAILAAWNEVAQRDAFVAYTTPPLGLNGRPLEMVETPADAFLGFGWPQPADLGRFLTHVRPTLGALDRAIRTLDEALAPGSARDAIDRRYAADADLLRHTLLVHRFTIGEGAVVAATEVPADAWTDPMLQPGLNPVTAIPRGFDPETAILVPDAPIRDRPLAERVRDDRRRFLSEYRGTPFGELVGRNSVHTLIFVRTPYGTSPAGRASPAESEVRRGRTGPGSVPVPGRSTGGG